MAITSSILRIKYSSLANRDLSTIAFNSTSLEIQKLNNYIKRMNFVQPKQTSHNALQNTEQKLLTERQRALWNYYQLLALSWSFPARCSVTMYISKINLLPINSPQTYCVGTTYLVVLTILTGILLLMLQKSPWNGEMIVMPVLQLWCINMYDALT